MSDTYDCSWHKTKQKTFSAVYKFESQPQSASAPNFTGFKALTKSLRISSSESDIVYWRLHFDKCHFHTLA